MPSAKRFAAPSKNLTALPIRRAGAQVEVLAPIVRLTATGALQGLVETASWLATYGYADAARRAALEDQ